jgi:CheY-like chemotaxis protein
MSTQPSGRAPASRPSRSSRRWRLPARTGWGAALRRGYESVNVNILVVEDDRDIRAALVELLEDEGVEVVTAAGAGEALGALRARLPDVILLDLLLPGVGGRELLTYLELMPALSRIPVVVMTASGRLVEGHRLLRKPFRVDDVLGAIRDAVSPGGGWTPGS